MKNTLTLPTSLKDRLTPLLKIVSSELESNERLKWLLLAGFLIAYLALLLFTIEQYDRTDLRLTQANTQLSRLLGQSREAGWAERAKEAQSTVDLLSQRFWPGETSGLAEAAFERWIRQTFEKYGTEVRQVQLTRSPALEDESVVQKSVLDDVRKIRAKVIGPFREDAVIQLLSDAAEHSSWVIVEQLIIRSGRNPRFEMDLATFSRPEELQ